MTAPTEKKSLRHGYTTGACAAAAARAAVLALLHQEEVKNVDIELSGDNRTSFKVSRCIFNEQKASCTVIKDAGDDPDSTDGAEIRATVSQKDGMGITITGGKGVGMITKPGLEMPVGLPAINPVPRRMIEKEVREIAGEGGMNVTISVPGGEKLARKTLNSRLGITGGISILGTTGIVIPYSVDAYQASISRALDIAVACGCRQAVLTTGRRSEKYAQAALNLAEECFIQAGDYIGYSLEECAKRPLDGVIIWGMTGKISKLAAGDLYTNVSDSKIDIDFLAGVAAGCGVYEAEIATLKAAVTANHFRRMLRPEHVRSFCNELCHLAANRCRESINNKLPVICIMSDYEGDILGRSDAGS